VVQQGDGDEKNQERDGAQPGPCPRDQEDSTADHEDHREEKEKVRRGQALGGHGGGLFVPVEQVLDARDDEDGAY